MRILFLSHRLPYAPNRGDRVRAYHMLRFLSGFADVHLASLVHDDEEASQAGRLAEFTRSVTTGRVPGKTNLVRAGLMLPTNVPTTHTLLRSPGFEDAVRRLRETHSPDVVLCFCTGVGPVAEAALTPGTKLVLDMVDVDSAKWATLAGRAGRLKSRILTREARLLKDYERRITTLARATSVVTDEERDILRTIAPEGRIEVIPNGVDATGLRRGAVPYADKPTVVFCGVMDYAPNIEGVVWFTRQVWPDIRRAARDAEFEIVGSNPTSEVRALGEIPGVRVVGAVADVKPHLWRAWVGVAPLLTARGIQNKVLEALGAGLPAVVTPVVNRGLPRETSAGVRVAEGASSFANEVATLLAKTPDERRRIAASSQIESLSWEHRLSPLRELLNEVVAGK